MTKPPERAPDCTTGKCRRKPSSRLPMAVGGLRGPMAIRLERTRSSGLIYESSREFGQRKPVERNNRRNQLAAAAECGGTPLAFAPSLAHLVVPLRSRRPIFLLFFSTSSDFSPPALLGPSQEHASPIPLARRPASTARSRRIHSFAVANGVARVLANAVAAVPGVESHLSWRS